MLKLSFWIGTPSIITYLASTYSQILENIFYLFALSAAALVMAIRGNVTGLDFEALARRLPPWPALATAKAPGVDHLPSRHRRPFAMRSVTAALAPRSLRLLRR